MNDVYLNKNCKVGVTLVRNGKFEDVELRMFMRRGDSFEPTAKVMRFGIRQIGGLIDALENIRTEVKDLPFDDIDIESVTWVST